MKKRSKTSKLWSLLFFLVNLIVVGVVFAIQINSEAGVGSFKEFFNKNNNLEFILIVVGCFIISQILIGFRLNALSLKFGKKSNYLSCVKSEFICQYYNKITPFSFGGQPFQVFELTKCGVKANNAIAMVSCNYVSQKLIYWVVALFMMLTIATNPIIESMSGASFRIVLVLAIISLVSMSIFLTFVILVCLNKKLASKLVALTINFLNKLKIVKNRKKVYFKIMCPALSFQHKMKVFFTSKKFAIFSLALSLVIYIIQSSIPAFIYFIFEPFNLTTYWQLLSVGVIIQLSFGVNPIPGGSGVAELSFSALFALLIDKSYVFWALILWRILTYYIYLIFGIGIVSYDYIYGNKKAKRRKQKLKSMNNI
ncbi:MAG: flippase-like domain-containing protein [Clostridia bacterium]|nr:flippase-like domain-containing protein [Clostridia bacterium]